MTHRLFHLAVTGFCLLSLLACAGTAWLWSRSYSSARDRVYYRRGDAGYTVRSENGRITLFGPPFATSSPETRRSVADLAARMTNDQVSWEVAIEQEGDNAYIAQPAGWVRPAQPAPVASPAWFLMEDPRRPASVAKAMAALLGYDPGPSVRFSTADVTRPLLSALDDPNRFAAAHVLLTEHYHILLDPRWPGTLEEWLFTRVQGTDGDGAAKGAFLTRYNGMWVKLFVPPLDADTTARLKFIRGRQLSIPAVARADPAQIPDLREQWHRLLDVPIRTVPHWLVLAATALPPLLWTAVRARRAWVRAGRRRLGYCPNCGFDLCATPEQCPECGTLATGAL